MHLEVATGLRDQIAHSLQQNILVFSFSGVHLQFCPLLRDRRHTRQITPSIPFPYLFGCFICQLIFLLSTLWKKNHKGKWIAFKSGVYFSFEIYPSAHSLPTRKLGFENPCESTVL